MVVFFLRLFWKIYRSLLSNYIKSILFYLNFIEINYIPWCRNKQTKQRFMTWTNKKQRSMTIRITNRNKQRSSNIVHHHYHQCKTKIIKKFRGFKISINHQKSQKKRFEFESFRHSKWQQPKKMWFIHKYRFRKKKKRSIERFFFVVLIDHHYHRSVIMVIFCFFLKKISFFKTKDN